MPGAPARPILAGRTILVDGVNGATAGVRGRADSPYSKPSAARSAASAGDTISVRPGSYDDKNLLRSITATVTSITRTSNSCVASATAHPFTVGNVVLIAGTVTSANGPTENFNGFNGPAVISAISANTFTFTRPGQNASTSSGGVALGCIAYDFGAGAVVEDTTGTQGMFDDTAATGANGSCWSVVRGYGSARIVSGTLSPIKLEGDYSRLDVLGFDELASFGSGTPGVWVNNTKAVLNLHARRLYSRAYDAIWIQKAKSFHIEANDIEGGDQGAELSSVQDSGFLYADTIRSLGTAADPDAFAVVIGNLLGQSLGEMYVSAKQIIGSYGVEYSHTGGAGTCVIEGARIVGTNGNALYADGTTGRLHFKRCILESTTDSTIPPAQIDASGPTYIFEDCTFRSHASGKSIDASTAVTVKIWGNCRATTAKGVNVTLDTSEGGSLTVDAGV